MGEDKKKNVSGLALMREPFPDSKISKLPKPTRKQTDDLREGMRKGDFSLGVHCELCGQWHHKKAVHLDYVGHAALTDRLLECDPEWNWEPTSLGQDGAPHTDADGGMWIRLTVCGVTRLGYGHPDGKTGGNAVKETIGDALRNAAMRFGAALDLWHKGDLHNNNDDASNMKKETPPPKKKPTITDDQFITLRDKADEAGVPHETICAMAGTPSLEQFPAASFDVAIKKLNLTIDAKKPAQQPPANLIDDEIPY